MIFPFLAIMIESFEITENDTEVGYYAGLLASSFSIAQFFSSFFWGYISDRWGRRPVMLTGLIATSITMLFFGFATSLWMAILARYLNGLVNGNAGIYLDYAFDLICDFTN
eukprot:TRINITY_DN1787_c0_g1_i2.p1 TRINITY_DN1787_c0_g1~~TRINITY_DN1787_c0_g1_i2.p1  ORF type:complete len:111 (+),score=9.71 TRINITY_DN1787_c0_g1_i2:137-469(+)